MLVSFVVENYSSLFIKGIIIYFCFLFVLWIYIFYFIMWHINSIKRKLKNSVNFALPPRYLDIIAHYLK